MKTIKTDNQGGFFPKLDDIALIQDEVYTTIASLFSDLGKNFVVQGCVVSIVDVNVVNISAGIVFIDGEFCRFDGVNNLNISAGNVALVKGSYVTSSPRLFNNSETKNVYKERKAIVGTYIPEAE
jgi:hypothetical protein